MISRQIIFSSSKKAPFKSKIGYTLLLFRSRLHSGVSDKATESYNSYHNYTGAHFEAFGNKI